LIRPPSGNSADVPGNDPVDAVKRQTRLSAEDNGIA